MNCIRYSRFFNLLLSFSLLIAPLQASIIAHDMETIEKFEDFSLDYYCLNSFIYLGKELSPIADFVVTVSSLDDDNTSPLHQLKTHIENGFLVAEHDAVAQALHHAEIILQKNYSHRDQLHAQQLYDDLEVIAQKFLNGLLKGPYTNIAVVNGLLSVNDEIIMGSFQIGPFSTAGVLHNDSSGNVSSSLIVNADITASTITNASLATVSSANNASYIVARDGSGNFSAGTITANLTGTVTGGASLDVLKAGDTMTGTLTHPAGTAAAPSIQFTGSTNTGISAATTNTLSFDTNGVERLNISSSGVTIDAFSTAGVVHNSAAGLLSSSLIVNADITAEYDY